MWTKTISFSFSNRQWGIILCQCVVPRSASPLCRTRSPRPPLCWPSGASHQSRRRTRCQQVTGLLPPQAMRLPPRFSPHLLPNKVLILEIKNSLSMIILIIPPQQGYSAAQLPPPPPPSSSLPAPLPFPSENEVPAYPPPPSNYGAIQVDQIDEVLLTSNQQCFVLEP